MEDTHGDKHHSVQKKHLFVLILIIMEDTHGVRQQFSELVYKVMS